MVIAPGTFRKVPVPNMCPYFFSPPPSREKNVWACQYNWLHKNFSQQQKNKYLNKDGGKLTRTPAKISIIILVNGDSHVDAIFNISGTEKAIKFLFFFNTLAAKN